MLVFLVACTQSVEDHPMDYDLFDMKMRYIPSGTFCMGGAEPDALPIHKVTLTRSFWLADIELTQQTYQSLMKENPSGIIAPDKPVEQVRWLDAINVANALSEQENLSTCYRPGGTSFLWEEDCTGYRLPTEAEWEYAARGKTEEGNCSKERPFFAGDADPAKVGWFKENSWGTQSGRRKNANERRLYDISGNVAEWVWDGYSPYPNHPVVDPKGVDSLNRISRGGGWSDFSTDQRLDARSVDGIDWRFEWVGLRIARTVSENDIEK
ncbi:MAG: SUMF1/EgtB/PvdO family nonheme iron enzyme [Myxococcota bacterium]|nr:SUMF1/EgtB/PvdO family nonheme iron enzyme [Myxococcota bacterium]